MTSNWRKSSYSGGNEGNCVEVGASAPVVAVRDSKQEGMAHRDVLAFTPAAWEKFTINLKQS
jgi:hypothetical protein